MATSDVSPINRFAFDTLATRGVGSTAAVRGVAAAAEVATLEATATQALLATDDGSTVVQLSSFSRLLELAELTSVASSVDTTNTAEPVSTGLASQAVIADFDSLLAQAQLLVDSFNSLELSGLGDDSDVFGASTSPFVLALDAQINGVGAGQPQAPLLSQLADIGVDFAPALPGEPTLLTIDVPALQAAFAANPAETQALVQEAVQSLARTVGRLAGQTAIFPLGADDLISPTLVVPPQAGAAAANLPPETVTEETLALQTALADTVLQDVLAANVPPLIDTAETEPIAAPLTGLGNAAAAAQPLPAATAVPTAPVAAAAPAAPTEAEAVATPVGLPPTAFEQAIAFALSPTAGATAAAFLRPEAVLPVARQVATPLPDMPEVAEIAQVQPLGLNLSDRGSGSLRQENADEKRNEYMRMLNAGRRSRPAAIGVA